MANTLTIVVENLNEVTLVFNKIKVYRSNTIDGIYNEITSSGTRPTINIQDTLYTYTDTTGLSTHYYKTSFFHDVSITESELSDPILASNVELDQLLENMQIELILSKDIKSIDASSLTEDQYFTFLTTLVPFYSSVRKVRLEIGSFITSVTDDIVSLAIFEASLEADQLLKVVVDQSNQYFNWARREWVTCKAAQIMLTNTINNLRSKMLDNFRVEYEPKHTQNALDKIDKCLAKWEIQLITGGTGTQVPKTTVRAQNDPDAPHAGRMWEKGPFSPETPGSNVRYVPVGSRLYIHGWRPRRSD